MDIVDVRILMNDMMDDDVMLHLKLLFCSVAARNAWKKKSLKEAFLSGSDDHLIRHQMAGHSDGVWQQFHLCSGNEKIPVCWVAKKWKVTE